MASVVRSGIGWQGIVAACVALACAASAQAAHLGLYWSENTNDRLRGAVLDGSGMQTVVDLDAAFGPSTYIPNGMTTVGEHLYWVETNSSIAGIYRSTLDGGSPAQLVAMSGLVTGSSAIVDVVSADGKLFWTGGGSAAPAAPDALYASNLDGTGAQVLVDLDTALGTANYAPHGLTHHNDTIYWIDHNLNRIYSVDADGSSPQVLVDLDSEFGSASYQGQGITTDGTYLYWSTFATEAIYRSNLDGSSAQVLFEIDDVAGVGSYFSFGIKYADGHLYWTDGAGRIHRTLTDGSDYQLLGTSFGMSFGFAVHVPEPASVGLLGAGIIVCLGRRRTA